ncbi:MAG: MAPEG family protein [Proteobacteria bacterium]|nr:MAPEG family protein [Pseudomonadota bacterium]MDA0992887.1 MAPEG family protein [Pseudomonadota bacterium]
MELVAIVTALALLQVFVFSFQAGQARIKTGINAPAMSGAPEFERASRVHLNTIEQLIILIPSMWMFANYVRADIAAGLGIVFIVGRQIYRSAYLQDPGKRTVGFSVGALAMMVLLVGGLVGAVMRLL